MKLNGFDILLYLLASASLYSAVGFAFAWRAKCRFRKNIFG